ncbi:MAG: hypothetical protein KC421_25725, partial [Anaerolineales bacterium]|nr:hypothetical protein [Anaerolineales bacterium]
LKQKPPAATHGLRCRDGSKFESRFHPASFKLILERPKSIRLSFFGLTAPACQRRSSLHYLITAAYSNYHLQYVKQPKIVHLHKIAIIANSK